MKPHWENLLMSSVSLYIDNLICTEGEAFVNYTGEFYSTKKQYNQYYAYSLPFKQIVSDVSVPNANILQGIYINNQFINDGRIDSTAMQYVGRLGYAEYTTIKSKFKMKRPSWKEFSKK